MLAMKLENLSRASACRALSSAFATFLLAACGSDGGSSADAGSSSGSGGSAGSSVSGGSGGGSGSSGSGGGGSGSGGTSAGTGSGGTSAGTGSGGDGGTSGDQPDSGLPPISGTCSEPVPATSFGNECPSGEPVSLTMTTVASDLNVPVFVTHAPGDEARLFVVEQAGTIKVLDRDSGEVLSTFLDLSSRAVIPSSDNLGGSEYGLLGLTFHPNYPEDPRVFVNYTTDPEGLDDALTTVISSFEVSSNPDVLDMASEQVLLTFGQPGDAHNGGMLAFGRDGCMYVGAGDGGGGGELDTPGGRSQELNHALGKILRLDVDSPRSRAPGNLAEAEYPHIYSYGLRNPWRFSFDRMTGDLYIGDVGGGGAEEVNVTPRGVGNLNYGWALAEGDACREGVNCTMDGLEPPVHAYPHIQGGDGMNCVIGGYVYRGEAIPSLHGWYVYGDSGPGKRVRALVWDGNGACSAPLDLTERDGLGTYGRITSFGEDAQGELYVTDSVAVFRIEAAP